MIGNKYVRAQEAHCQDLLREAERDRLTYGQLLDLEPRERRGWTFQGLRIDGRRMRAAFGLALAAIVILVSGLLLSGGALNVASVLP